MVAILPFLLALRSPFQADLVANLPAHSRVLFQGDSITDMNRGRNADPNHLLGHSYAFIIGAKAASTFPDRQVEFFNRGISGNKVSDLEARWQPDTLDLKPTLLSIMIGINDLDSNIPESKFEADYDHLIAETTTALPKTRLVLCEPFGLGTGRKKTIWNSFKADLNNRQAIVQKLAAKYDAILVKLQTVFEDACNRAPAETWVWDGIHPTYAGQQLIADEWVKTVNRALTDPLLDPSQNSAINPIVNFERDSYDWLHRHADVLDTQAQGNPDVVMIGDSITHFWGGLPKSGQSNGPKAWDDTFKGVKVLNMGYGWDRTQNVLWRLQHGEFVGISPKSIVLNIGTNNLVGDSTARLNTPEEVAVGIQEIVNVLHERSPKSRIFIMAVFPRGFEKGNDLDRRIMVLNKILKAKFDGFLQYDFVDIGSKLRDADGAITKEIMSDGTHPTEKGYQIWGTALRDAGAIPPSS